MLSPPLFGRRGGNGNGAPERNMLGSGRGGVEGGVGRGLWVSGEVSWDIFEGGGVGWDGWEGWEGC